MVNTSELAINEVNYHLGILSDKEMLIYQKVMINLYEKYKDLPEKIGKVVELTKINKGEYYLNGLIIKLIIANLRVCLNHKPDLSINELLSCLRKDLLKMLPVALINDDFITTSHYVLYEPSTVLMVYLCRNYMNELNNDFLNAQVKEKNMLWLQINLLRSILSIISLIAIGDDVHAISLFRGFLEQSVKIIALGSIIGTEENYHRFVEFNAELQRFKAHPDTSLSANLKELMTTNRLTNSSIENYLSYGWINPQNTRINFNSFADAVLPNDVSKIVLELYRVSSEFVHEDYVGVDYDYIRIRGTILNYIHHFLSEYHSKLSHRDIFYNGVNLHSELSRRAI